MMTQKQQEAAAKAFAKRWQGRGGEKQETQLFWIDLLSSVYGLENATEFIKFEYKVQLGHKSYIDAIIPETHIIIEQKSLGIDMNKPIRQSDGTLLTPFEQAKRYANELPHSEHPRWIINCNFSEFHIFDMERPNSAAEVVYLKDLGKDYYRLKFLTNVKEERIRKEMEISKDAGLLVGKMYEQLYKQYKLSDQLTDDDIMQNINKLCVRLVFCLYAEDAGLFGRKNMFHDYLAECKPHQVRKALLELFRILDTKVSDRSLYEEANLLDFPYVNGSLFSEVIEIPQFQEETLHILLEEGCGFDWSEISPTIFGGIFESTLNPETRRHGGMHYTSIENIHKVIDPLFLNDLKEEYYTIINKNLSLRERTKQLKALQEKMAKLNFLDPAAGSGNFLTESYLSLRRLENEILRQTVQDKSGSAVLGFEEEEFNPIKVKIHQFYGIEINDFAVAVARTALWIAEAQMLAETQHIIHQELDFFPLHNFVNIHEGNALRVDWKEIIAPEKLNYIMGNPPFVGSKYSSTSQKDDMSLIISPYSKKYKKLDYVVCWHIKASEYIQDNKNIVIALVSTNSISQGEQVSLLWSILEKFNMSIVFAHQTFKWSSESLNSAAVHCIILGIAHKSFAGRKYLYTGETMKEGASINPYLLIGISQYVSSSSKALCNQKKMIAPNKPCDYNHLKIEPNEYEIFKKECPSSLKWIKRMMGANEFINNKERYCLWLVNCSPSELNKMPLVMERVKLCRKARLAANTTESLKLAETPTLFREQLNPESYLLIPAVSSENRRYIPIGFLNSDVIPVMGVLIVPNANIYDFGILTSNVHMAWMRAVCGRLESRYRYSKDIVYNNFPWPEPTAQQREEISKTAQAILDARALYPDSSLADLYDSVTMPKELREAHRANDRAVMKAYGFSLKMTEEECLAELMKLYSQLVNQ